VKLRLLWVGRTQEPWVKAGIEEYSGRVKRYAPLELAEVKEEKGGLPEHSAKQNGSKSSCQKTVGSSSSTKPASSLPPLHLQICSADTATAAHLKSSLPLAAPMVSRLNFAAGLTGSSPSRK